ncbi:MAG: tRNA (N6-isopentenyl adenosine(37)-C2)-methylthiotransferase MiaB [Firmicutes bacterium]|nr:tRNA (N6-isopentenyl adenosine(37)-C2)-methylthiotransferase MiaB [Bacillota bacterium]
MNVHDSEVIAGLLQQLGYEEADELEEASLLIFNTCCVRENPERKIFGRVGNLRQLKEENPRLVIAICGCMVQQPEQLERIRKELPHVNLVFGTHNVHRLPELLTQVQETGERLFEVWDTEGTIVEGLPAARLDGLKAFVNIIYGCTNFCTYCIVPYVRGRERSRQPEAIRREIEDLAAQGYREVTLLGQNVNAYGKDLDEDVTFAGLLRMLDGSGGMERIRFTTSHPRDMSDELIEAMADLPTVCEHLHLPLQAGSDRILAKMNRGYTKEQYINLVNRIRDRIPDIALTSDLIVGFPGETEEDFEETLRVVEEIQLDSAFTFIFSPRPGTVAAKMENQVPEEVKKERIYRLIELQNRISLERNRVLTGSIQEVLVEGPSQTDPDKYMGRTRGNKLVIFTGAAERGRLVPVKITEARTWSLHGELMP